MIGGALWKVIGEVVIALGLAVILAGILVLVGVKGVDRITGHRTSGPEITTLATVAVPAVVGLVFAGIGLASHQRRPFGDRAVSAACRFWVGAGLLAVAGIGLAFG